MIKQKFLNLVLSLLVVASLLFGGINKVSAQEPAPTVPQGSGQAQDPTLPADPTFTNRVTPAERQAAADSNTARGLLPGLAKPQPVVRTNKRGVAPDPSVVPHYFGPFANYANSPLPMGVISSITVDTGGAGTGYTAGDPVDIYDVYGTGSGATAVVGTVDGNGGIVSITVTAPGANYSAPMVVVGGSGTGAAVSPVLGSLTGGIKKFVDSLPGLGIGGANNLGNYLTVATPDTTTYPNADYYEIELGEYTQQLHSDLPPTTLRGYRQTNMGGTPYSYLGPTIVSTKDRPVRIKFTNSLPTGAGGDLFIPVDTSVMGAGEGPLSATGLPCNRDIQVCAEYSENRATLHLHGGLVPWISDGTPHQWTTPAGEDTQYPVGVSTEYVPDMWYDANGDVIPGTEGQTTQPVGHPDATNNPSGPANINGEGSMTFYYGNQQSARLQFYHDHAYGITRLNVYAGEAAGYLITDQVEKDLIDGTNLTGVNPNGFQIPGGPAGSGVTYYGLPLLLQDKTFVDANTIAAQDPTWKWGTGEIIGGRRVPNTGDLWLPSVYMPVQNPFDLVGEANAFGRWQYGPWFWPPTESVVNGPIPNEYYDPGCDPALTWCEPPVRPDMPTPSMGMEAYMDTSLVNGAVYPYLEVDPKAYRFRLLNAANDRFYNLSMFVAVDANGVPCDVVTNPTPAAGPSGEACTEVKMVDALTNAAYPTWPADSRAGGAPDPLLSGPDWIQIGTEGGFLPAPAVIPAQPITWQMNPGLFNVGNVLDHSLLIGNAERADVIVDFSQYAGKTIIVYNDAPTAFPALDPRYDYYTGNPSQMDSGGAPTTQPGYGPNTRTVMQIRVSNIAADLPFDVDGLNAVFAHGGAGTPNKLGVFEKAQNPIIVPQAAYNSAYGANFPSDTSQYVRITDRSMTFTPMGATEPVTISFQEKAIHDEMGATWDNEYGRMSGNLGLELPGTNNLNQNIILYGYASPPVDFLADSPGMSQTQIGTLQDGTTLWKITHNGVDTHPIHIHLANAQLINRVGWDGLLLPPDANELGWKETIRINPLESTIWAVRPELPTQPFDIPNSERLIDPTYPVGTELMGPPGGFIDPNLAAVTVLNHVINYGWEYVWHCHILSHEEMDMMHSLLYAVTPAAPTGLQASGVAGTVNLQWMDNSVNETAFTIQRSTDGITWTNIVVPSSTGPSKGGTVSYSDTGRTVGALYLYRVMATNTVGDTTVYAGSLGFPTVTKNSVPSNASANKVAVSSIVREAGALNPTSATSVNFTVTFSQDVTGVDAGDFTLAGTATSGASVATVTPVSASVYTVTVNTGVSGTLGLSVLGSATTSPDVTDDYTTGELYTVDKAVPVVVSVVRTAGSSNPTNLTGVNFTVTFDVAVTGVDVTDFSTVATGLTTTSVKSVTGSGTTYTVTALTGSGVGTLGLDVLADGTILGSTGNALAAGYTTSELYDVDKVAPTVSSIALASTDPAATSTVDFTVTFSEAITGLDAGDFSFTYTGGVAGAKVTSVTGTGPYTVTVNTGTGDTGTLRLNVFDNNSILDAVGNPLGGPTTNHYMSGPAYTIAKPLTVLSAVRLNPNPSAAATVSFRVIFSRNVTGVDAADFALAAGSIGDAGAPSVTPGANAATYDVSVTTGTGSGTIGLDVLNNGSIFDLATGIVPLSAGFTGQVYTIDRAAPTVSSSVRLNADPTSRTTVFFTVTFSKPVTGVDATDFSLTNSVGITGTSVVSVSGTGAIRTVGVTTGTGDGTVQLNVLNNGSIKDAVNNVLSGPTFTAGQFYTVDKSFPTVLSSVRANTNPTNRTSVFFTVTFSEAVTGVDMADFSLTTSGVTGASITSATGTGATRTVGVNTGTGNGTILLNVADNDTILDIAGSQLGGTGTGNGNYTAGQSYTVDKTVPTVVSINRANASPTNSATRFFTVTFSESVTGVDAADFILTTSGISGATITSVTGSGTTRSIGVNTGTGDGTIRLDLNDNDTIVDLASNPIGGAGAQNFITGQVYTVDKTVPTVVSIVRMNPNPTSLATVFYTVTFSESVTGVNAGDFVITRTGAITGTSIVSVTGSGATRIVSINTGTLSGTIRLDVVDDDSIRDLVTNRLGGTGINNGNFNTGDVYNVR